MCVCVRDTRDDLNVPPGSWSLINVSAEVLLVSMLLEMQRKYLEADKHQEIDITCKAHAFLNIPNICKAFRS